MKSEKSYELTLVLAILGGALGLHRFYVGKIFTGFIMLFTNGLFGVLYIIDIILIISGKFTDSKGNIIMPIKNNVNNNKHYYDPKNETVKKNKVVIENTNPIVEDKDFDDYFNNGGAIKYK